VATITKVGKKFRAEIRRKDMKSVSRTFATRRQAEMFASGLEHDVLTGKYLSVGQSSMPRLREALQRYDVEVSSKKTSRTESCDIRAWNQSTFADLRLNHISTKMLQTWVDSASEVYAADTVRKKAFTLSGMYSRAAKRWGYQDLVNPIKNLELPSPGKGRTRRLQYGEYRRLMRAIVEVRPALGPLVRLSIYTAMRRGELCGLKFSQINYRARFAHLSKTKNGDARDVPLSRRAIRMFRLIESQSTTGKVWDGTPDRYTKDFAAACKKAEIEDLVLHDLRHEATSRFFEVHNLSIVEVQRITGHRSLKMLLRYTHLSPTNVALKLG